MKGLILAGGVGSRLRPLTHTQSKQLIPVANKPILYYGLEALAEAGITEVGIVVGVLEEEIRGAVGDGSRWGLKVDYIHQESPLGLAHAVLTAQDYIGDEEFVMYLGDNLVPEGLTDFVRAYEEHRPDAQIFLVKVPEPERFGVAVLEGDRVVRLVEKPKEHISDLALAGVYIFNPTVFRAASAIEPSHRGELEITDAIQYLIDHGYRVRAEMITGWWKDTGKMEDLIEANRIMLERREGSVRGSVDEESHLVGDVIVEEGATVRESVIRGPAIIGSGAVVERSIIGPYVAVHDDTRIEDSEIENSILLSGSLISEVRKMSDSLVGKNVRIRKDDERPSVYRFMLGDNSEIRVP
ncbi:MAG TPA: glucose-1-phosphate thymidylyltransferase [Actinomycetota bacterium]|nr:glucose-1-phosphate thymidylyltransferase [Actinomycetota bacterium]